MALSGHHGHLYEDGVGWFEPSLASAEEGVISSQDTPTDMSLGRSVVRRCWVRDLEARGDRWAVETGLHWGLDVALDGDGRRVRRDHAPVNRSLLRQRGLNLLGQEKRCKNGVKVKRSKAGWDDDYWMKVLDSCSHI